MKNFEIINIKDFMSHLLLKDTFDSFLCKKISFDLLSSYHFEGKINKDYATEAELNDSGDNKYVFWNKLRPVCSDIIIHNRTPISIKAVFLLSNESLTKFLANSGLSYQLSDVSGLFINIRFEKGKLTLITGSSLNSFSLDKSLDISWDDAFMLFLKKYNIN